MTAPAGRILIVDDEEGIREVLSRLVRKEGFEPLVDVKETATAYEVFAELPGMTKKQVPVVAGSKRAGKSRSR